MFADMNNADFIFALKNAAHPLNEPSAEHAAIMDEAARRIRKLESQVKAWEKAADNGCGCDTPEGLASFINCV